MTPGWGSSLLIFNYTYYLIIDRILITSCVATTLVSRTVDLTFLAFSLNVMVALGGLSLQLLLTLCRRLIRHFKTCISYLFPCEPRASPSELEKLALLDGTFASSLSKTVFGDISPPFGRPCHLRIECDTYSLEASSTIRFGGKFSPPLSMSLYFCCQFLFSGYNG